MTSPLTACSPASGWILTAVPNADVHVAAQSYIELWHDAMQLVQDSGFPVRVGAAFELEALEAFGFLAMSCQSLREAYERTARVRALYNVGSRWELTVDGERLRMTWLPWALPVKSELAWRSVNEYQVAEMLSCVRQMTARQLVPLRVAFRHSAPRDVSAQREFFERAPEYGSSFDGFEAEAWWLDEPLRGNNPKLRAYFEKQCQLLSQAFAAGPEFSGLVRQRLASSMEGGSLSMADVARSLGTSERSLHRRLSDEGTRFNDLLDQVRRQFAEQYLARPRLAIAEVAYLLGFNDASAFLKAFRRWTGVTPGEYRLTLSPQT
ncbi:MAG: AraC family transcriptional regulator ligand-binding domain-containing protein [Polyangiaceae bacterium]